LAQRNVLAGANFSGRSAALRALLQSDALVGKAFLIGPYAEAALSGLTNTVRDEVALYGMQTPNGGNCFAAENFAEMQLRDPQSLSGGEQVMLALHCFSQSAYRTIAVDTAFEQLDPTNRAAALDHLRTCDADIFLIDNRAAPEGFTATPAQPQAREFSIDWAALAALSAPQKAAGISITNLNFNYPGTARIFVNAGIDLEPRHAYRVSGANGAGKTTLFKILVGALAPDTAEMTLGGQTYRPWRDGNRALALATQNPDQQWCGATLREDMTRRRRIATRHGNAERISDERLQSYTRALGNVSLDAHLYELPLAARKRLSWSWPFAGVHPWILLDEPTVGQDRATRESLARHLTLMCEQGYGVLFVTHDDEFAASLPHRVLLVANRAITLR